MSRHPCPRASAKYSWRGEVDDQEEYYTMLYQEGVKSRDSKGETYYELVKDASRHLPGCLDLNKKQNDGGGDEE